MTEVKQQASRAFQPDSDVHITLEDQQKINQFAKCNAKHEDVRSELKAKQNELKNLEDATEELILQDEHEIIPYLQGEVFICLSVKKTNDALENAKLKVSNEIRDLEEVSNDLKHVMSNLKTQLYAKFGDRINLEEDES